jgi:hypothetical protein
MNLEINRIWGRLASACGENVTRATLAALNQATSKMSVLQLGLLKAACSNRAPATTFIITRFCVTFDRGSVVAGPRNQVF